MAKRNRALRAAQYLEVLHPKTNRRNRHVRCAQDLKIVRTYLYEGRSDLRIKRHAGLIELIDDVQSGRPNFSHTLVYDVSRWGRFQNVGGAFSVQ